jgi:hypothetical protein
VKSFPLFLSLSLAANLALGAVWFWRTAPAPAAAPAPMVAGSFTKTVVASVPAAPDEHTWTHLTEGSDAEFVARLRAEGFPPRVLAALVRARVAERHADALRKFKPSADFAYWRRNNPFSFQEEDLTPEQRAERRALNRQMADEARQLLGEEADEMTPYERADRARLFGNLPTEKVDQLSAVNRDYGELTAMVRDRMKGMPLPEDRAQLVALEAEKRADLAAVLTPAELLEYDLRASQSAMTVRARLRNFDATEDEYRALTTLQLAFDRTYGGSNASGEQQQRRAAAQAELNEQIKALLPADRYAEYEVKTDNSYVGMASLLTQYNPSGDAGAAVLAQKDLATRYNALRNDRTLSPDVRNAQLDALSVEANTRMTTVLGAQAFEIFRNNGGPINSLLKRKPGKP